MLDLVAESIDKLVEQQALNSFYYNSTNFTDNSTHAVADRIIALSQRKIRLINIKVAIEKSLEKCPLERAQLLVERYIDNDKAFEIARRHDYPLRTYFRKLVKAEEFFADEMQKRGYTEERLESDFQEDKWILDVYKKFKSRKFKEEVDFFDEGENF